MKKRLKAFQSFCDKTAALAGVAETRAAALFLLASKMAARAEAVTAAAFNAAYAAGYREDMPKATKKAVLGTLSDIREDLFPSSVSETPAEKAKKAAQATEKAEAEAQEAQTAQEAAEVAQAEADAAVERAAQATEKAEAEAAEAEAAAEAAEKAAAEA